MPTFLAEEEFELTSQEKSRQLLHNNFVQLSENRLSQISRQIAEKQSEIAALEHEAVALEMYRNNVLEASSQILNLEETNDSDTDNGEGDIKPPNGKRGS